MSFSSNGSFSLILMAAVVCFEKTTTKPLATLDLATQLHTQAVMSINSGAFWVPYCPTWKQPMRNAAVAAFLIGVVQLVGPERDHIAPCHRLVLGSYVDVGGGEFVLDTRP